MKIYIKLPNQEKKELNIQDNKITIGELKQLIVPVLGVNSDDQRLLCKVKLLKNNDNHLEAYEIKENDVIVVVQMQQQPQQPPEFRPNL